MAVYHEAKAGIAVNGNRTNPGRLRALRTFDTTAATVFGTGLASRFLAGRFGPCRTSGSLVQPAAHGTAPANRIRAFTLARPPVIRYAAREWRSPET